MAVATFNQTGGTFNITPGNNLGYNVSSNSRSVNFTLSGGTLTVNGNASTATVNNAYDIESSTLLPAGSWTTLPKPPVVESASAISYIFTLGTPVKNFARLKVTQIP